MSQHRKHRGYATQELAAAEFRAHGWPYATTTGAGRTGIDLLNVPGLAVEVKATPGDVTGALRQAVANAGLGLPLVVWRPNGYGPERVGQWPVIFRFHDALQLLNDAGYGDKA